MGAKFCFVDHHGWRRLFADTISWVWPRALRNSSISNALIVMSALLGLILFYAPYLSNKWSFAPWGDTIHLTGPLFCEISRSIKVGAQPWMNWSTLEAIDYNVHVATYYPLYLFGWRNFCSIGEAVQAADTIALLHIGIFFFTTLSLIRATGTSTVAALVGASFAATLPNMYIFAVFPTFIAPLAWLPLSTEGLLRLCYRQQYLLGGTLLAAGTGAMLTAGPGSNVLSALVLVGSVLTVYSSVYLVRARDAGVVWRLAATLCLSGIATVVLCWGSTVNVLSHLGEMIRWTRTGFVIGRADTGNFADILAEKLSWSDLGELLYPAPHHTVGNYLLGPVLLVLAIIGAITGRRSPAVLAFAFVACLSIAVVFVLPRQIVILWSVVPGLNHTRHLSIVAAPLALAATILAAHGFHAVIDKSVQITKPMQAVWSGAGVLVILLSLTMILCHSPASTTPAGLLATFALTGGAVAIALPKVPWLVVRRLGGVALLLCQFVFVFGSFPKNGPRIAASTPTWQSIEAAMDYVYITDLNPRRLAFHSSINSDNLTFTSAGTLATYRGLATLSYYMSPRIYWKFAREIEFEKENHFGFVGGKYLVAAVPLDSSIGQLVFENQGIRVYSLTDSRPLVATYCVSDALASPTTVQTTTAAGGRLPRLDGVSAERALSAEAEGHACETDGAQSVPRLDREHNAVDFFVSGGANRLLVLNYSPYASWQLRIGGRDVPIYNLRDEQMVAWLPDEIVGQGTLSYLPKSSNMRVRISKLAWLALCIILIILAGKRCRQWPSNRLSDLKREGRSGSHAPTGIARLSCSPRDDPPPGK